MFWGSEWDVSGIRAVMKRQPRQYINRKGGFNRPLPVETNRRGLQVGVWGKDDRHHTRSPDKNRHKPETELRPTSQKGSKDLKTPESLKPAIKLTFGHNDDYVSMGEDDEAEMMKMMGIPSKFNSTHGKHVEGAYLSGISAVTKRQQRQYMNRRGQV